MSESMTGGRAVGAGQGWAWIADGFGLFRKSPGIWIALVILLFVILLVFAFIPLLGVIATILLWTIFLGGLMHGCRVLQRGGELELGHLFAGFEKAHAGNLLVLGILELVGVVIVMIPVFLIVGVGAVMALLRGDPAAALAMGGVFLLAALVFLALSVPVAMAFWFAPALVVLRGVAPVAAIQQSFFGCLKNVIPFLIYGIVMLVLSLALPITLGLALLVLLPTTIASVYVGYRDIFGDA